MKTLSKKLRVNPSTLKHALDRFSEGNQKSLCEIGLVEKIQLDENNPKSPNFYYKIKKDGNPFNSSKDNVQNMQIEIAHAFNSSIVKQKIIIDLLIYANIIINERGVYALEKFCKHNNVELIENPYNAMIEFLQTYFDMLDHEKHCIAFKDATREDMLKMFDLKQEIIDNMKKTDTPLKPADETKICTSKKQNENSLNEKQANNKSANQNCTSLHIFTSQIKEVLDNKNIDVEIACDTYKFLQSKGKATTQDIVNYIHETIDPDDFNNETTPLKIDRHLNQMFMHDLLEYKGNSYELTKEFIDLVNAGGENE